ncbi:MAG TPA: nucleotide disphospho-sugar-binding domain-containing protein, partial [Anaerolineales bacterium]|nr:nucleotide disphospho-sugar-binding domain-containing protein [Anaerolineales bacterium]
RVAAVIHHGGAGTTAAGLRAGRPSVIVPSFGDQFFWGGRTAQLGAGPAPIPRRRLTARKLAGAIQQAVGNQAIATAAAEVGQRIQAEDGIGTAVDLIERFARKGHL